MRSHRRLALALVVGLLPAGCLWPTEPSTPRTVVLAPGQAATYGVLTTRFVGVTADSRCPANAFCIQQGDAVFTVEARVRNEVATTYQMQINDAAKRRVVHAGYTIEATELAPYPFTVQTINPIPPGDYRLTLTLERP